MKISYLMLSVSAVIFAWLTVSYLRPVPAESYEHVSSPFMTLEQPQTDVTEITASLK